MTREALERIKITGRNDPCPCGSGKKYKKCHLSSDAEAEQASSRLAAEEAAAEVTESEEVGEEARTPHLWNRAPLGARGPGTRLPSQGEGGGRRSKLPRRSNG